MKRLFEKHQNEGFEVIGISLYFKHVPPDATAEEKEAIMKTARSELSDFLEKGGLRWSQNFENLAEEGEFPRRFGAVAIPWMLLVH
ncbi:MAG: hypothetical protein JNK85_21695 [Verrucomicrobiales bacterium]|nr:hypothetical protein [Verrucomicrobiales bacterium]